MKKRTVEMLDRASKRAFAADLFLEEMKDGMKRSEVDMWSGVASAHALASIAASLEVIAREMTREEN